MFLQTEQAREAGGRWQFERGSQKGEGGEGKGLEGREAVMKKARWKRGNKRELRGGVGKEWRGGMWLRGEEGRVSRVSRL
eukprot:765767-Hanusia_phi.AAC.1